MTLSVPQLTKDGRVIFNSKSTLPALVHPTMVLYVYWEEGNFPPTCDTCLTWQHIPMMDMDKEANLELKQQIQNDILKYGNVEDFEPTNILVATWRDVPPYPAEIYSGHQVRSCQQTRDIEPLLVQCWASVVDGGPTLNQQWLNGACLLG